MKYIFLILFKKEKVGKNSVIDFDYALKGKQDPVDIRYKVIPVPEDSPIALAPQIKINSLAIHMASNNEEELDMVFHRINDDDIKPYNADFGMMVFFQPKDKISKRKHCKALFFYAEGKGLICTFIFFDNVRLDLKPYESNMVFSAGEM